MNDKLKKSLKIVAVLLFCVMILCIYKIATLPQNVEYANDLNNIKAPTQVKTTGKVTTKINNYNVDINYVAKYSISGRVVDVQEYYGTDVEQKLAPRDVGISWGFLAKEENDSKIRWTSTGNRFLYWHTDDGTWLKEKGGNNGITAHHSNNHLIPSDDKVNNLIAKINEGDFIRIEGYLVNIDATKSDGAYFRWNSSTSRNDTGKGACEIIYVNTVTWLEE